MRVRGPIVCLFLAAALLPALRAQSIPAEVKTRLALLLPSGKDAVRFYSSDLYRYMDGGADIYLKYGLVALAHQEYKDAGVETTADVFDMRGPLQAFGIYSSERSPEYHFIDIGAEGYSSESTLNFLQGRYYVKLTAFGDRAAPALENFARAISRSIGPDRSLPALLDILPSENRIARSEKYLVQAPAGHDFLAPALMASYRFDGQETSLLVSLAADAREANQRVERLRRHYLRSGKVVPEPELGPDAGRTSDPRQGDIIFFARGRLAVLCLHAPPRAAAFLAKVKP
ncbi:MAG: DUF6599 family protein [Bryobacteraceae bacterium]|jgi:hypothetical protein